MAQTYISTIWGTQLDPAWVLRRGMEAVKEGAALRGLYENSEDWFFQRFEDREGFRQVCKQ
jgi:hypothetical protein